jgi:hypothetical protein
MTAAKDESGSSEERARLSAELQADGMRRYHEMKTAEDAATHSSEYWKGELLAANRDIERLRPALLELLTLSDITTPMPSDYVPGIVLRAREALRASDESQRLQPKEIEMETVDSTNGTTDADVMRMQYRTLTPDEQAQIVAVKGNAASLYGFLGTLGNSRELSLAKTKVEEAVMWATKHITR